ncbi:MAG: PBP1A family penicillin-binding protein [Deltaproteobacteria bacterium]
MEKPGKRILGRFFFTFFFVIPLFLAIEIPIFLAGASLGTYLVYSHNLPPIPELKRYQPRTVSTFYADDGTVIGIFYKQKRFVVDLAQIPPHVINAFLAAEDARFFEHSGVDWMGMARAALRNLRSRRYSQGGSTITMQVTRNFLLTREKRISRKIKEMILATRLEKLWGKKRILHIYLNEIYLGEGCYGVEAAARNYFDKPVEHLSVAEGALIAGLVAGPARYNPFKSVELAQMRKNIVLENMLRAGFIDRATYDKAMRQKLVFRKEIPRPFDLVPDFAEAVRRYIIEKYGADSLYNQGLKVFTTCRIDYQREAVEAVEKGLQDIRARHKHFAIIKTVSRGRIPEILKRRRTPKLKEGKLYEGVVTSVRRKAGETVISVALSRRLRGRVKLDTATSVYRPGQILAIRFDRSVDEIPFFVLDDHPQLQGALVSIENRTGYVRALVGGASREHFKFNRAMQAKRQPGSAFKPIIYATAIEKKSYSPATIIVDEPIVVDLDRQDEEWEPKNAGGDFLGPISLRRALELSRNICTIKILMDVGFDDVTAMAKRMGIHSHLGRNLSLSLGTSEVTLFELTAGYTVFPNSGVYLAPTLVKRVEDRFGNVLEDNTEIPVLDANQIPHPVPREEFRPVGATTPAPAQPAVEEEDLTGSSQGQGEEQNQRRAIEAPSAPSSPVDSTRTIKPAMSPQTAYVMTDLLQGGVRAGTSAGMRRYLKRKDLAGKTGTTNNAEDAWFIGFTPDYTTGVWVGFDEKRPLGRREEGGRAALPIWGYFMRKILKNRPEKEFPVPPHITFSAMLTFAGNKRDGFFPETVREPVYTPFVGKTLVLSPLDPPGALSAYADAMYPGYPYGQTWPGASPYAPAEVYPPGTLIPVRPGTSVPAHPMGGRDLVPAPAGPRRQPEPSMREAPPASDQRRRAGLDSRESALRGKWEDKQVDMRNQAGPMDRTNHLPTNNPRADEKIVPLYIPQPGSNPYRQKRSPDTRPRQR